MSPLFFVEQGGCMAAAKQSETNQISESVSSRQSMGGRVNDTDEVFP
jgi:hypothetical protein